MKIRAECSEASIKAGGDAQGRCGTHDAGVDESGLPGRSRRPGARAALFAGMPMNPQGRLFAEIQINQNLLNVTFKKLGIVQADED
jgi:hypothetical protein